MTPATPTATADQPLLLDAQGLARLLGISKRTVWRYADAGELPAPQKIGSLVRWRRDEILRWLQKGKPGR